MKRLNDAREKGQFAKSPEIQTVMVLAGASCAFILFAGNLGTTLADLSQSIFANIHQFEVRQETAPEWLARGVLLVFTLSLPFMLCCWGAAIVGGGLQSGFRATPKAIEPKLEKISPIKGFKRVFSKEAFVKVGVDATKLGVIGGFIFASIHEITSDPIFFTPVSAGHIGTFLHTSGLTLVMRIVLALSAVALIDYLYKRHKNHLDLMMTRKEVDDERKNTDGNPHVKAAQRLMSRRLTQNQMLAAVPTADVLVTNPTHYAVALKYEAGKDQAPIVLARGERLFAKRLKAIAREHGVPMVENRPVARLLFKYGRVGKPIPAQVYQAVAEILAYVYRTHRYYFHDLKSRRGVA